jgi:hypothetical protein
LDALDPGFVRESRILGVLLCDLSDLCGDYPAFAFSRNFGATA